MRHALLGVGLGLAGAVLGTWLGWPFWPRPALGTWRCQAWGSCFIYAEAAQEILLVDGPTHVFFFDHDYRRFARREIDPELSSFVVDRAFRRGERGWVRVER